MSAPVQGGLVAWWQACDATTIDDPIAAKLGEVRAEIARLRAENERLTRQASAPALTPERAAILDEDTEATARMVAAIQGQARDGETPDQTVERLIRERDELRAERATWDSVEKERKKLATRVAELRDERERLRDALARIAAYLGVTDAANTTAIVEGAAAAREELDEARLLGHAPGLVIAIQTAIPTIRAGINALGSSEEDVRQRNTARDAVRAMEAAAEGQAAPAAVLSAAERKAVEALRRWRELPDERIGDPFAAEWLDVLEAADAMIEAGRPLASEGKEG